MGEGRSLGGGQGGRVKGEAVGARHGIRVSAGEKRAQDPARPVRCALNVADWEQGPGLRVDRRAQCQEVLEKPERTLLRVIFPLKLKLGADCEGYLWRSFLRQPVRT